MRNDAGIIGAAVAFEQGRPHRAGKARAKRAARR
jgi:hypothetical protein